MSVHGRFDARFAPVREAFAANFSQHREIGAACCVYLDGQPVLDLWGGVADPQTGRPWREDTLQLVFSAAKGPTTACVLRLVEQGQLELDAPVARYWPAFAAAGKEAITLRMVLSHRAGLAAVDAALTLDEVLAWEPVVRAIAAQAPNWPPGTAHGYHARSFGWILGELVRRVAGERFGQHQARTLCAPLGLDYRVGTPPELLPRCARLVPPPPAPDGAGPAPDSLFARVLGGPSGLFGYNAMWNRPEVLAAEMPSSNGVGTARALARFYAATVGEVDGLRALQPGTIEAATRVESRGPDRVLLADTCFGLGFSLPPMLAPACGPRAFGPAGAGGALAFADPDARLGFAYVTNAMQFHPGADPRTGGVLQALYGCLG